MRQTTLTGLVIRKTNLAEADKIITIFTREHGKKSLIAKGIRRIKSRRSAHLELLNLVRIQIHKGKQFDLITEAKCLASFSKAKSVLVSSAYLFYLAEALDKILPLEASTPDIFDRVIGSLVSLEETIETEQEKTQAKVKKMCFQLLWDLGYLPHGTYPESGLTSFLEKVVERPIASRKLIDKI